MPADGVNICKIQHWISSTIICIWFTLFAFIMIGIVCMSPEIIDNLYQLGGSLARVQIMTSVVCGMILISNIFLAYGIYRDWPFFILVWLVVLIILWKLFLIFFIWSLTLAFTRKRESNIGNSATRFVLLFAHQLITIIMIVAVGTHCYSLCDDAYDPTRARRFDRSIYRMSQRTRAPSMYSTRMPAVLGRIDRTARDK